MRRASLVVDREINEEPVVELAVKAERILGVSLFQLAIRSQPDRGQLSEELRPRNGRGAQAVGGDIIQWRSGRMPRPDRIPDCGVGGGSGKAPNPRGPGRS
ncbi:MAG TPA: hypothetical protein VGH93_14100, partial [Solirubrobacteraceae bacterium]